MKYFLSIFLLTSIAFAAEETENWSCYGTAAAGLSWENNKWETEKFGIKVYRIELQGLTAAISENNDPALLLMDCEANTWSWSCTNDAASLELNKELSTAVLTRFFGGIFPEPDSNLKDSIYIEAMQCTKL